MSDEVNTSACKMSAVPVARLPIGSATHLRQTSEEKEWVRLEERGAEAARIAGDPLIKQC